jgi:hypothetical protein
MFTITGTISGRKTSITWWEVEARPYVTRAIIDGRGLESDDRDLVFTALVEEESDRMVFGATPTGPFYAPDLDRADAAFVQLTSYFEPGYKVTGDAIPELPGYPALAVA